MTEKAYPPEPERTKPAFYAALYPALLETAQYHGYTLAIHGSMVRDFDLVAVPWTESATTADKLIHDIAAVHCSDDALWKDAAERAVASVSEKPHGRRAYTILLGGGGPRLDISVMPTTGPAPRGDES
ncbi:MAG: hypothetical protein EKK55_01030 [Rhodocyclaceae bacterium]|nr:MAG: hypothetical protein EKK55_01030 [Rhodocyclaceae bacterium]